MPQYSCNMQKLFRLAVWSLLVVVLATRMDAAPNQGKKPKTSDNDEEQVAGSSKAAAFFNGTHWDVGPEYLAENAVGHSQIKFVGPFGGEDIDMNMLRLVSNEFHKPWLKAYLKPYKQQVKRMKEENNGVMPVLYDGNTTDENRLGLMRALLDMPDILDGGYDGQLLIAASRYGVVEVVKQLLKQRKNINVNLQTQYRDTALTLASVKGHEGIVKALLGNKDINVNVQINHGHAALTLASFNGHEGIVQALLEIEDIDVNVKDQANNRTALDIARSKGHTAIIALLENPLQIRLNKLAGRIKALEHENEALVNQTVTQQKESNSMMKALKQQNDSLQQQTDALKQQNDSLQQQTDALKQ